MTISPTDDDGRRLIGDYERVIDNNSALLGATVTTAP